MLIEVGELKFNTVGISTLYFLQIKDCLMLLQLTNTDVMDYPAGKCLKSRLRSRMQPGQSVAFFTPITFYGRGGIAIQDPQGESYSLGYVRDFNTRAHPIRLKSIAVDFLKSHVGANHESNRLQQRYIQRRQPKQSNLSHQYGNCVSAWLHSQRQHHQNLRAQQRGIYNLDVRDRQIDVLGKSAKGSADFQSSRCTSSSNVCQNSQSSGISPMGFGCTRATANQSTGRNGSIAHWTLANDISKRECSAESGSAGRASFSARGIAFLHIKRCISQPQAATSNHIELCKALRSSFALILNITRKALAEITAGAAIACAMAQPKYETKVL